MGMPAIVAVGAVGTASTGACVAGLPAGWAADDVHLLFIEAANEPLNAITGFTRIGAAAVVQSTGLVTDASAFYRRAVGGDTAPSITSSPQNHLVARIIGVRGCVTTGSPVNGTPATGLDNVVQTAFTIPGGTTNALDCMVFAMLTTGQDSNTEAATGWTNASLANLTERIDNWTNLGNGGGIAVASGDKATPGAYSATTGTVTTANTKAFMSFALQGAADVAGWRNPVKRRTPSLAAITSASW